MKPGERIKLIKKLAKLLAGEEWNHLDLTLRQFGFPWSSDWAGSDKYAYALHNLEHGKDEELLTLYDHLLEEPPLEQDARKKAEGHGPWKSGLFRLFMSHITADKRIVAQVKRKLADFAVDAFVAHKDIAPTKEWITEIESALESCDALAAFLTTKFHTSKWTDQEVGYCLKRRVLIIPVQMGIDPYGFLARYQGLQAANLSADDIATKLFNIILQHDLTAPSMARALATQFSESSSFASAKRNASLLEQVKLWTPELLRSLENALENNTQIAGAYGVPETIRRIVKKHGK